jgi:3-phosphoshikimate 1-carboxyvinyltransferase
MTGNQRSAVTLHPVAGPLTGRVIVPGSKSITNRALLLAALAKGRSVLSGALKSDDTRHMATALRAMGVSIDEPDATTFIVQSSGQLQVPSAPLFLGNAGTATRFLTAAVATIKGTVVVDGDEHMRKRPIAPLLTALRSIGIDATSENACPPVTVKGSGKIPGGRIEIDGGLSSQYVSALLMMAPCASAAMDIVLTGNEIGARGYIDLTFAAMRHFGAVVNEVGAGHWQVQPTAYVARDYAIEPDASAATYLWAAEVLTGGRIDIGMSAESFSQPDALAHAVIAQFPRMPAVIDGSQMQDAIPTLAALAAFNASPVRFTGIENLRVKECDRTHAMATELSRVRAGLAVEEGDDLVVNGDPSLAGQNLPADIFTYADHRIAMSMAMVALKVSGLTILDPSCVAKTFPQYWDVLQSLGVKMEFRD